MQLVTVINLCFKVHRTNYLPFATSVERKDTTRQFQSRRLRKITFCRATVERKQQIDSIKTETHQLKRKRSPYVSRKTFDVALVVQLLVDFVLSLTATSIDQTLPLMVLLRPPVITLLKFEYKENVFRRHDSIP